MSNLAGAFPFGRLFYINSRRYAAHTAANIANMLIDPNVDTVEIDYGSSLLQTFAVGAHKRIVIEPKGTLVLQDGYAPGATLAKLPGSLGADVNGLFHLTNADDVIIENYAPQILIGGLVSQRTCMVVVKGGKNFLYRGPGLIRGDGDAKGPWCGLLLVDTDYSHVTLANSRGSGSLVGTYTANATVCLEACNDYTLVDTKSQYMEEGIDTNRCNKRGIIRGLRVENGIQTGLEIGNHHGLVATGIVTLNTPQSFKLFNYATGTDPTGGAAFSTRYASTYSFRNAGIKVQAQAFYDASFGAAINNVFQVQDGGNFDLDLYLMVEDQVTQPIRFMKINGGLQGTGFGARNGWVGMPVQERLKLVIDTDQAPTQDAVEYDAPSNANIDYAYNGPLTAAKAALLFAPGGDIQDDPGTGSDYLCKVNINSISVIQRSFDSGDAAPAAAGIAVSIGNTIAGTFHINPNGEEYFGVATELSATGSNTIARRLYGSGSPEGVVAARIGTYYDNLDTSAGQYAVWYKFAGVSTTNTGWRPLTTLEGSATVDIPSLAAGAVYAFSVPVTGAVQGDICIGVSWSGGLSGLECSEGEVVAGQVNFVIRNDTAGAINPASQTVTTVVAKK